MSWRLRALISLLFLVSGGTALVYQVTWLRNLSLIFGASFEATSIVLAAFMTGLSAGGFAFGRRVDRAQRAFAVYGVLELGVAAFAFVVPALLRGLDAAYVRIASTQDEVTAGLNLLRVAFALLILFVPTFLMGGTLPVLTRGLVRSHGDFGPRLAWLYGINTLGAVFGALGAGFVLLPAFGVWHTQLLAVAANVAIAGVAFAAARFASRADAPQPAPLEEEALAPPLPEAERHALRLAYWGTALAGFCALALEVMWTRSISLSVGATTYSFTVMLAAFLTGIWLGSWLHAALPLRRFGPALQLGAVLCAIGLASVLTSLLIPRLPDLTVRTNFEVYGLAPRVRAGTTLLVAFAVMLPPCVLMGIAFPLAAEARLRLERGFGRAAGDTLGLNTLGAIAGSLCAGFVLIPRMGLQRGMLLAALLYFAYGCLLLATVGAAAVPARRRALAAASGVAIALAVLATRFIPAWDTRTLGGFLNDRPTSFLDREGRPQLANRMAGWSVLYYREGRASTVSVLDQGWYRTLVVNGKAEASDDSVDRHIQLLLGHVPVLMHRDPKSAFILGMGTGITLGAVTAHPGLEEIVLGEIEPAVLGARPHFAAVNGDPLGDPRLRVEIQDGRNYLKTTPRRFDVITADPIHPWTSGSVYLYTKEYYRIANEHLTPDGVMCQWLPLTGLSEADVRSVMATFAEVFPHVTVWQASYDVLLIGSARPIVVDYSDLAARLAEPRVARQLGALGLEDPVDFLAELGMDDAALREYAAQAVVNTDDNVYLEFSSPLSIGGTNVRGTALRVNWARTALTESGKTFVEGLDAELLRRLDLARRAKNQTVLAQVLPKRELERLQAAVADAPDYRPARVALAHRLVLIGTQALEAGYEERALARAEAALRVEPEEPSALLLQGSALTRLGRYADAIAPLERALALDADRWMSHYQLGFALFGVGRNAEAVAALERAIALNPTRPELDARLADARAAAGGGAGS